jgi:hypothetical protein
MAEPIVAIASRQLALVGVHPSAQLSARENFFQKKYHKRKAIDIQYIPLDLYIKIPFNFSNLRHKTPSVPKIFAALL